MLRPRLAAAARRSISMPRATAGGALAHWRLAHARQLCAPATVNVTFVEGGEDIEVAAEVGKTLLEVAHANDIDLEGACDGSLACSTCHLILPQSYYDALAEPDEEELDMLDLAFGLTDTSRLGCQIKVDESLEGIVLKVPDES